MISRAHKVRYPFHALVAVVAAGLLFVFDLVVGFLFMALVPPLIPVYVMILFAAGSLVRTAADYAARVSVRQPAGMLRLGQHDEEARQRLEPPRTA